MTREYGNDLSVSSSMNAVPGKLRFFSLERIQERQCNSMVILITKQMSLIMVIVVIWISLSVLGISRSYAENFGIDLGVGGLAIVEHSLREFNNPLVTSHELKTNEMDYPGGWFAALATSSVDLSKGQIKVLATENGLGGAKAWGEMQDTLYFHLPNGMHMTTVKLKYQLMGIISAPNYYAHAGSGTYFNIQFGDFTTGIQFLGSKTNPLYQSFTEAVPFSFEQDITVYDNMGVNFNALLSAIPGYINDSPVNGETMNFNPGLIVSLDLPEGVSFTSDSAVFLTESPDIPDPNDPQMPDNDVPPWKFSVGKDRTYYDPEVSIGYDYKIVGDKFLSVILPEGIGDNIYDLYLFDDTVQDYVLKESIKGGVECIFPAGGIESFRVLGIETDERLDPGDPTIFVTGLSFLGLGDGTLTMNPISQTIDDPAAPTDDPAAAPTPTPIPEPSTALLLGASLIVFAALRKKIRS